jgi:hypothetical protein
MSLALQPVSKDSGGQFSKTLTRFQREGPTIRIGLDAESDQTINFGLGELHLDIYVEWIRREYKVDATVQTKEMGGKDGQFGKKFGRVSVLGGYLRMELCMFNHVLKNTRRITREPHHVTTEQLGQVSENSTGTKVWEAVQTEHMLRRRSKVAYFMFTAVGHVSSWSDLGHMCVLITLNMSKAYLSFIKGDFGGYLKSIIASFIMDKKKLWGKECFQKKVVSCENNDAEQGTLHVFGPDMSTKSTGFPLIFKKLKDLVLVLLRELQCAEKIMHAMLEICGRL